LEGTKTKHFFPKKSGQKPEKTQEVAALYCIKTEYFFSPIVSFYRKHFHLQGTFFFSKKNSKKILLASSLISPSNPLFLSFFS
jgi:hypothetical protein